MKCWVYSVFQQMSMLVLLPTYHLGTYSEKASRSQSKAVYLKNSEDLHYEQLSVAQASGLMDVGSPAVHWDLPRSLKGLHFRQETKVKKVMKTIPKTEL